MGKPLTGTVINRGDLIAGCGRMLLVRYDDTGKTEWLDPPDFAPPPDCPFPHDVPVGYRVEVRAVGSKNVVVSYWPLDEETKS